MKNWMTTAILTIAISTALGQAQERPETPKTPATKPQVGSSAESTLREIRRYPVHNHNGPGDVGYYVEYSNGVKRFFPTGGGGNSDGTGSRPTVGGGANDGKIQFVQPKWVDVDVKSTYTQQDSIVKSLRQTVSEDQERVNRVRKEASDAVFAVRDQTKDAQQRGEANISSARADVERYSEDNNVCPEGNSRAECIKHPEYWAGLARLRAQAMRDAANAQQKMDQEISGLKSKEAQAREKYDDAKRQGSELKSKGDALKNLTTKQNAGELWLNPYGGKNPTGYLFPKATLIMDENAPGKGKK